jgi:hypothetical protein
VDPTEADQGASCASRNTSLAGVDVFSCFGPMMQSSSTQRV